MMPAKSTFTPPPPLAQSRVKIKQYYEYRQQFIVVALPSDYYYCAMQDLVLLVVYTGHCVIKKDQTEEEE